MNEEIKERWLARLRDGSRQQGEGRLEKIRGDGTSEFCCLGVLCELAVEDGVITRTVTEDEDVPLVRYDGEEHYPSAKVREWAGLEDARSSRVSGDVKTREAVDLARANDEGKDFADIARYIERGL